MYACKDHVNCEFRLRVGIDKEKNEGRVHQAFEHSSSSAHGVLDDHAGRVTRGIHPEFADKVDDMLSGIVRVCHVHSR